MSKDADSPEAIGRREFLRRVAAWGALVVAGAGIERSRWWLQVTDHTLQLPGLARAIRVVHLSDLHHGPWVGEAYLEQVVERCETLKPDLIVITGDLISEHVDYAARVAAIVGRLRAPSGVYAVLGNHDHWIDAAAVSGALEAVGIPVLTNRAVSIDGGLWLVGLDDVWAGRPDLDLALAGIHPAAPTLVLSHNPRGFDSLRDRPAVVLSGHTHGGQVALPLLPRVLPPDMAGTPYVEGWYRAGRRAMYVSRGVGMVFPPVRICCRPELAVHTLTPA